MFKVTAESSLEMWRNTGGGRVILRKFAHNGELKDEIIRGGKVFSVSPEERQINQNQVAEDSMDPFKNGLFAPVKLVEEASDFEELQSNPNLMSDDDIKEMLDGHYSAVEKQVQEIDNLSLLSRIREVASEIETTVGKMRAIDGRLDELKAEAEPEVEGDPERTGVTSLA